MASLFGTLRETRARIAGAVARLLPGRRLDAADLEALNDALILADVGPETSDYLVAAIRDGRGTGTPRQQLAELMVGLLQEAMPAAEEAATATPHVVLVVGVNGSGKTTTAAKLAALHRRAGRSVILGAADTFRAAAVEQLKIWGERLGVPVVAHRAGGDPAAVAFDTCEAAVAREVDVAIVDTAGRLHTKSNLMAEIDKIRRVVAKVVAGAPHDVLLVLDGTTGQNGLRQAEEFLRHAGVTGLVIAKLDGTARGGVALTVARKLGLPIRFVGTGEGLDDLAEFDARAYVEALLGEDAA